MIIKPYHALVLWTLCIGFPTKIMFGQTANNQVVLQIVQTGWANKSWYSFKSDTTILKVKEGMLFGSKNSPAYFTLHKILNDSTIKVGFSDELVVAGEAINNPSKQNPTTVSNDGKYFRTRLHDGGSDFCVSIIKKKTKTQL